MSRGRAAEVPARQGWRQLPYVFRRTGTLIRPTRPGAIALLASSLLLLLLSHPLVHGDGISYLIYLDSVARDGDLDLSNQVARFAPAIAYPFRLSPVTHTPVTPFPFGSAYLLAPFYWLGRALDWLAPALRGDPAHFQPIQALPLAYSLAVALGAHAYALAAVWLAYRAARRIAPGWAAAGAAVCCLAGTPLLYYAAVEPMDAHVYGTFALSLAVWLATWAQRRRMVDDRRSALERQSPLSMVYRRHEQPGWVVALAVGLALGLAVLVRWQLLLYALPLGFALVWRASRLRVEIGQRRQAIGRRWSGAADRLPPAARLMPPAGAIGVALAFAAGLGIYCALCGLYFWRFFGAPLVIPNDVITGHPFVGAPLRYLPQVLFWRYNGWLSWSPVAALGLAGLVALALWGAPSRRALALAGIAGIALELALNASLDDWYAGWAFGQRRMTEAYPLLVLGVAWLIAHARWGKLFAALTAACALYSLFLLAAHLYYTHTSGHPEGGGIAEVAGWLLSGPHGPTLAEVFRDRYGPWAWARPEL